MVLFKYDLNAVILYYKNEFEENYPTPCPGGMVTWFKVSRFELILRDAALVRSPLGEKFRQMYGNAVNPLSWGIRIATDF